LLTVKTGPLAQGGIQLEQGIATFLKEKNNTLAARKIEPISADTGGGPAGAKNKAQEVIERDNVNVILGPLAAVELLAITDYVRDHETLLISSAGAEGCHPAQSQSFRHSSGRDVGAVLPRDGRLRRKGSQVQNRHHHVRGSHSATNRWRASSASSSSP
jgi:hypothetical protein